MHGMEKKNRSFPPLTTIYPSIHPSSIGRSVGRSVSEIDILLGGVKNTEVVNNLHSSPSVPPSVGLKEGPEMGYCPGQFECPTSEMRVILV